MEGSAAILAPLRAQCCGDPHWDQLRPYFSPDLRSVANAVCYVAVAAYMAGRVE